MIVALAGRRVDPPNPSIAAFPPDNVPLVRQRLADTFDTLALEVLVCSAACGADLLALQVAGTRGVRRRVILPLPREEFRQSSVTDRPGEWGPLFDAVCDAVAQEGDLVQLAGVRATEAAYRAANAAIFEEALALARGDAREVLALLVWEGPRDTSDLTREFRDEARQRGIRDAQILTTP